MITHIERKRDIFSNGICYNSCNNRHYHYMKGGIINDRTGAAQNQEGKGNADEGNFQDD